MHGTNIRSTDTYAEAFSAFLGEHPEYGDPAVIDSLRATDYARLDELGHAYLDYTGAGLYASSQITRHRDLLARGVYGNPHSANPTSMASSELVREARDAVRRFFNASAEEYEVIFTSNASGALKLVGEAYPFRPGSRYLLSYDNHNSVNGIREFARAKGARVTYLPVRGADLRMDPAMVLEELGNPAPGESNLFAYPAQSNFSGVRHPLEWVDAARDQGWDVILDVAAYAPTSRLDLSSVKPDFVPLSFYKMFGYPTGTGALLARRESLARLERPWFAGGTITLASVQGEGWHHLAPGAAGFEDGTVDFLGLPAVAMGLEHLERVGIEAVGSRATALMAWLLDQLTSLRHSNGAPMTQVFGPREMEARGATVAFYFLDPAGSPLDVHRAEQLAGEEGISIRTGCFCNPGDGEVAHRITRDDMAECFVTPRAVTFEECHDLIRDATGKMPNTMRVSLGIASNFADVYRFAKFAETFRDAVL